MAGNNRESFSNYFASSQNQENSNSPNPPPYPPSVQNFQVPYPPFYFQNFPNYANMPHSQMPFYPLPTPPQPQPTYDDFRRLSVGGSSSDKEQELSFEAGGSQFPPHSTQPEAHVALNNEGSGRRPKAGWTHDEERCLAQAWSTISNCNKVGNSQKNKEFWQKTADYYNENLPKDAQPRTGVSIKSHYYAIMPDVNIFSGWYNNFYSNRASGQSDDDVLHATIEKWNAINPRKSFKYMHVWKVMSELEKWAPEYANKKSRTSESDDHASSGSEARSRPMGQQRAKRQGKNKVKISETNVEERRERWATMKEIQQEKLKQKNIELEQQDYHICFKDTSTMSAKELQTHTKIVEGIKARRGWI